LRLSIEAYFACTPQALMAGAALTLAGEFAGISAGLYVYADVLLQWDPFYLTARVGVVVWFRFCGRHEVGVQLQLHTPPLGGYATIDAIIEFDISFGDDLHHDPTPSLAQFLSKQLGVPAEFIGPNSASVGAFNTVVDGTARAGLFRFDLVSGRLANEPVPDGTTQEGVVTPINVGVEFTFNVTTRLPYSAASQVDLPLCKLPGLVTALNVEIRDNNRLRALKSNTLHDWFPAATFGGPLTEAQADSPARDSVGAIDPEKARIALIDGLAYNFEPTVSIVTNALHDDYEPEEQDERYPLPLGESPAPVRVPRTRTLLSAGASPGNIQLATETVSRRESARIAVLQSSAPPLHVHFRSSEWMRSQMSLRSRRSSVTQPPAGARIVAVPASRVRRTELAASELRILPARSPVNFTRTSLERVTAGPSLSTEQLTPNEGTRETLVHSFDLGAGRVGILSARAQGLKRMRVAISGRQTVRLLCLDRAENLLEDLYVLRRLAVEFRPARGNLPRGRFGRRHGRSFCTTGSTTGCSRTRGRSRTFYDALVPRPAQLCGPRRGDHRTIRLRPDGATARFRAGVSAAAQSASPPDALPGCAPCGAGLGGTSDGERTAFRRRPDPLACSGCRTRAAAGDRHRTFDGVRDAGR
jgi:hypothetical protein